MRIKGISWPIVLVGVLTTNFIGVAIILSFALRDPSFAIEEGYYDKALAWDEERAQQAKNAELGWGTGLAHEPAGTDPAKRLVSLNLSDKDGGALEGAVIAYSAFNSARAGESVSGEFVEVGSGRYDAVIDVEYPGLWVFRLRCERGDAVFTKQTDLKITPSAAGR